MIRISKMQASMGISERISDGGFLFAVITGIKKLPETTTDPAARPVRCKNAMGAEKAAGMRRKREDGQYYDDGCL